MRPASSPVTEPKAGRASIQLSEEGVFRLADSCDRLDGWIKANGFYGWDPFDVKGLTLYRMFLRRGDLVTKVVRRPLFDLELLAPALARKLWRIKPAINAKGMGLLAHAYLLRSEVSGNEDDHELGQQALQWLQANPSPGYHGLCWGYPFDWQSQVFVPAGTPSSVVTATVGNAFWAWYQATNRSEYLDACASIASFFSNDLNVDEVADGKMCFSYTPLDTFHCHNANVMVADFLARVGKDIGNARFIDQARSAARYTASNQHADGSFLYWGPEDDYPNAVDHFHTGFVLRSLYSLASLFEDRELEERVERGYRFYLDHLFTPDGIPFLFADEQDSPVNIHSCAEALLSMTQLAPVSDQTERLERSLLWTLDHMQAPDGHFFFEKRKKYGRHWTIKFPYLRWGQAWMALALFNLQRHSIRYETASSRS